MRLLFSLASLFLLIRLLLGKDEGNTRAARSRSRGRLRPRTRKSSKSVKSSMRVVANDGREIKDNKNLVIERDKYFDQALAETFDRDIERRKSFPSSELQSVEEEEDTRATKVDESVTQDAACDKSTDDDKRCEILLFLGRKFRSSGRVRRDASRKQSKKRKIRPSMNSFWFEDWRDVGLTVTYIISLFSSSAVRFSKFKSLRRFKPGD